MYDIGGFASRRVITADFAYVRLHGPGERYCGRYGTVTLRDWAEWLGRQKVKQAYVYFDNDEAAYAVRDALELRAMLEGGRS